MTRGCTILILVAASVSVISALVAVLSSSDRGKEAEKPAIRKTCEPVKDAVRGLSGYAQYAEKSRS